MSISEHSNGLASVVEFNCNRKKQDKRLNNHNFSLRLPRQTKHHSGDPRYAAYKLYSINFQWVFVIELIVVGNRESTNLLGMTNLHW